MFSFFFFCWEWGHSCNSAFPWTPRSTRACGLCGWMSFIYPWLFSKPESDSFTLMCYNFRLPNKASFLWDQKNILFLLYNFLKNFTRPDDSVRQSDIFHYHWNSSCIQSVFLVLFWHRFSLHFSAVALQLSVKAFFFHKKIFRTKIGSRSVSWLSILLLKNVSKVQGLMLQI